MGEVTITINDRTLEVAEGMTILEAAREYGIHIPTLCNLKRIDPRANCRICLVEVEKFRLPQPACATKVTQGMVVRTDTPTIRKARKQTLELILSDHAVDCHHCLRIGSSKCEDLDPYFCEMCFFCDCVRDGFCELQALAREYQVDVLPYEIHPDTYEEDRSTGSIIRNPNKCIKCRRCLDICTKVQSVGALAAAGRGQSVRVEPVFGDKLSQSTCVQCGRCAQVCPTGAIYVKEHKDEIIYHAHSYDYRTIAQIPEEGLEELADLFGMEWKEDQPKRIVAGLKKIGVDQVILDSAARDSAIARGVAALERMMHKEKRTIILTDSNSAKKFVERQFPDLVEQMLYYPSSQQEFGRVADSVLAEHYNPEQKKIKTISLVRENENTAEALEHDSVDYVINARELYRIFLRTGVDLQKIRPCEPDAVPIQAASVNGEMRDLFEPYAWEITDQIGEMIVELDRQKIRVAKAKNLSQARELLEKIETGNSLYRIIRIIA